MPAAEDIRVPASHRQGVQMQFRSTIIRAAMAAALLAYGAAASAAVTFIGEGSLSGNTRDQSGLAGLLEDGVTPHDQAGGFGSAIAYSGKGKLYFATPDRGPADGT